MSGKSILDKLIKIDDGTELDEYDIGELNDEESDFSLGFYWYTVEYYEGDGEMILIYNNKCRLAMYYLGHNSCYGPLDGREPSWTASFQEFLESDNVLMFEIENKDLENKVFEYLYKACTNV